MSVTPSPIGGFAAQFFDNNGVILSGGKIYTYAAGTTTPQATYTSAAGVTPHANPIVLDSAGRVPGGEIWLTDGLVYKFVIETSTAILIGTYDNITGVNSNFVNYTVQEEVITATAGQTVFNLSTINYTPGTNSLSVYIDGVNQYVGDSYLETDSNTVTFTAGLHVGAEVKFTTAIQTTTGAVDASIVSYDPPFTAGVATTVEDKLAQYVSVKDFGAVGDGVTDDTAAIQAAINASYNNFNKTVVVPNGVYKLTNTITITQGVMIVGEGSQGSNEAYGTVFKHYSNNSCFRWDGSGAAFAGTGGGLKNCLIVKADTYSGGNAIELVATSDNNRPGEMLFENVLAYGLSSGLWARGFVLNGTAANTPGSRGVRTVEMIKCRFADVSTANETVVINQASHFYSHGLACDTGTGSTAGITLKGINDGVYFNALGCAGTFSIVANDVNNATTNLIIDGKITGAFDNQDANVDGVASIATSGGLANSSNTLRVIASKKPGCFVYANANVANATGDGTIYQMALNTSVFDPYSNWGGNSFTVTVAGRYKVTAVVGLTNLGAAHTRADMEIVQTGSATNSAIAVSNPYANATTAGGNNSLSISADFDCEKGDVLAAKIAVTGGTKTVSMLGSSGTRYSYFIAEYIP